MVDHPEYLMASIAAIEDNMPAETSLPLFDNIFTAQEDAKENMAAHLESLAAHYKQMSNILHKHKADEETLTAFPHQQWYLSLFLSHLPAAVSSHVS